MFWNRTDISDKCPPYLSNESTEALTSNSQWTSEKVLSEDIKTPKAPITKIRELTLINRQIPQKYVERGVQWQQQPAFIVLCASFGLLLAVGHHMFYLRLNHTLAGSQGRQQFAHAFGNVLAIFGGYFARIYLQSRLETVFLDCSETKIIYNRGLG